MAVVERQRDAGDARFVTDEERWAAVVRRDRRADALFYYSARTTGIY
ncbi:MAG: Ada metal-binding domain-containing protein [Candidatus Rokuibacteriota bacterium]